MCYDAKSSLSGFLAISFISGLLWFRNQEFDRVLALFGLALAVIQLIEFMIHKGMLDDGDAARWLFIILWIQCFVLVIGASALNLNAATLVLSGLVTVTVLGGIFYALFSSEKWSSSKGKSGHLEWRRKEGGLLGNIGLFYLFFLIAGLLILQIPYQFKNIALWILLGYGLLSLAYVKWKFSNLAFSSMWCYLAVGFVFLAWFLGMFRGSCVT